MKNLLVTVGSQELPRSILDFFESYTKKHKFIEKSKALLSLDRIAQDPLVVGLTSLHEIGIEKCEIEVKEHGLFSNVVFIHTDFIENSLDYSKLDTKPLRDSTILPLFSEEKFVSHKNLIFPSPFAWVCSSLTFNVLSTLNESDFNRSKVSQYAKDANLNLGIEHEFFNLLGGFQIDIINHE